MERQDSDQVGHRACTNSTAMVTRVRFSVEAEVEAWRQPNEYFHKSISYEQLRKGHRWDLLELATSLRSL